MEGRNNKSSQGEESVFGSESITATDTAIVLLSAAAARATNHTLPSSFFSLFFFSKILIKPFC
jgi:hypothetical protein